MMNRCLHRARIVTAQDYRHKLQLFNIYVCVVCKNMNFMTYAFQFSSYPPVSVDDELLIF